MTKHADNGFARSPLPSIYCILAALLLMSFGLAHAFETKVETKPDPLKVCQDGYNSSSAKDTCSSASFSKVLNDRCKITYKCERIQDKINDKTRSGTITIDPEDADDLVNCDGLLKTTNC